MLGFALGVWMEAKVMADEKEKAPNPLEKVSDKPDHTPTEPQGPPDREPEPLPQDEPPPEGGGHPGPPV